MNSIIPKIFVVTSFFAMSTADCCCEKNRINSTSVLPPHDALTLNYASWDEYQSNDHDLAIERGPYSDLTNDPDYSTEINIGKISAKTAIGEFRLSTGWSNLEAINENQGGGWEFTDWGIDNDACTHSKYYSFTEYSTEVDYRKDERDVLTSAPGYLHLALDSIADTLADPNGNVRGRYWIINSIVDGSNQDLTNDPDWQCMTDNVYFFKKDGTVSYNTGSLKCDGEDEITDPVNISFSIKPLHPLSSENYWPEDYRLNLESGGIVDGVDNQVFYFVESDFDHVKAFMYDKNNNEVYIELLPQ